MSDDDTAPHPAALEPDVLAAQCEIRRTRRSGPGGQNRNKVETAIVMRHRPTGVAAEASERRTQGENLRTALFRLRVNLALEVRRPFGPDAATSSLWQSRCRDARIVVNPAHDDFPALLAEALDVVDACGYDLNAASERLGCSATQLLKFLKAEPRAFLILNDRRRSHGARPYR